jgi:hypothetical protein
MSDTPQTDNLARGNHVVPTEFAQELERERDGYKRGLAALAADQGQYRMEGHQDLRAERNAYKQLAMKHAQERDEARMCRDSLTLQLAATATERDEAQNALRDELDRPSRDVECEALRIERDALRLSLKHALEAECADCADLRHRLHQAGIDHDILRQSVRETRAKASDLHRRCQQAEVAVAQFKKQWDKAGGPRGGSFGRSLLAVECERLTKERDEARAEVAEHEATSTMRHDADMRGIAMWQAAGEGRECVWPDHGNLVAWLLGQLDESRAEVARLREEVALLERQLKATRVDQGPTIQRAKEALAAFDKLKGEKE